MNKLWLVAKNEFQRNVFKKSFILALLSVPLILGLMIGLGLLTSALENNDAPVGYVDRAGVLDDPLPPPADNPDRAVDFISFENEAQAQRALSAKEIQAYYIIPVDYDKTKQVELLYIKKPGKNATRQFYDFLQTNLLKDYPLELAQRAASGVELTIRSPDGSLEIPASGPNLSTFLPLITSFAFVFLLMMSSGYLMGGVVEEKENRMMEMLATSLSPLQMVAGKVLGIIAISFTQLLTWVMFAILALAIAGGLLDAEWMQNFSVPWDNLLKVLAIALPSYVLASGVMFTLGATLTEAQESQSAGSLFFMLFMLPIYMIVWMIEQPNGFLPMLLSLLPFTSLLTIGLRSFFSVIPLWQITLSAIIQSLCACVAIWLGSRAFRLGMLRYGQRLRLSEILRRRREVRPEGVSP